jgi:hypothetical protein
MTMTRFSTSSQFSRYWFTFVAEVDDWSKSA